MSPEKEKRHWLDDARNVTLLVRILAGACLLLVVADFFYDKHGHFDWESLFGFHGFFGFSSFFLLVLAGKYLRKVLMRDEDYYDR
jgi:hypothetical protein